MTRANVYERYMLDLINEERVSRGLNPLQLEQNLNQSADAHSSWMLRTDTFSHTGVGGSSAHARMDAAGFDFSGGWQSAENIAVQSERGAPGIYDDIDNLHTSLMNSPGHRANILDPNLEYIGIGIDTGNFVYDGGAALDSVIVTQNFASTGGSVQLDPGGSTGGGGGGPKPDSSGYNHGARPVKFEMPAPDSDAYGLFDWLRGGNKVDTGRDTGATTKKTASDAASVDEFQFHSSNAVLPDDPASMADIQTTIRTVLTDQDAGYALFGELAEHGFFDSAFYDYFG